MSSAKRRLRIQDLPKTKRPRERLLHLGIANLTDTELLAIVLGSGTKGQHVVSLAGKILTKFSLKKLSSCSLSDLQTIKGIGRAQASKIIASLELGKRATVGELTVTINTSFDVVREANGISKKHQEHLLALYLDARHRLIQKHTISIGTLNQALIEARDVFAQALLIPAASLILVHNHPSGDPTPSEDDVIFTKTLQNAGELLGISLIDHVIVAESGYTSLKDLKLLK